jgi:hypothetical protein
LPCPSDPEEGEKEEEEEEGERSDPEDEENGLDPEEEKGRRRAQIQRRTIYLVGAAAVILVSGGGMGARSLGSVESHGARRGGGSAGGRAGATTTWHAAVPNEHAARDSRTERVTRALRDSGVSGREDKDQERRAAGWFGAGASVPSGRPSYIIINFYLSWVC